MLRDDFVVPNQLISYAMLQ